MLNCPECNQAAIPAKRGHYTCEQCKTAVMVLPSAYNKAVLHVIPAPHAPVLITPHRDSIQTKRIVEIAPATPKNELGKIHCAKCHASVRPGFDSSPGKVLVGQFTLQYRRGFICNACAANRTIVTRSFDSKHGLIESLLSVVLDSELTAPEETEGKRNMRRLNTRITR